MIRLGWRSILRKWFPTRVYGIPLGFDGGHDKFSDRFMEVDIV